MRQQQKEPTTSVLDSVFYQSALRVNELEETKLNKIKYILNNKYQRYNMVFNIIELKYHNFLSMIDNFLH